MLRSVLCVIAIFGMSPAPAAETDERTLVIAQVIDGETDEPIESFRYFSGTAWIDWIGWQWQPHTVRQGSNGELIWPPLGKSGYEFQVLRIEADGYVPHVTVAFGKKPPHTVPGEFIEVNPGEPEALTIKLSKDRGVDGKVLTPTGEPAVGARVAVTRYMREVHIADGKLKANHKVPPSPYRLWPEAIVVEADAQGRFRTHGEATPAAVAVTHESGYALVDLATFERGGEVTLKPWMTADGLVEWKGASLKEVVVGLSASVRISKELGVSVSERVELAEDGVLRSRHLPLGLVHIARQLPKGSCSSFGHPRQTIELRGGQSGNFVYGGRGRPVVGRLPAGKDYSGVTVRYAIEAPAMLRRPLEPGECSSSSDYRSFLRSDLGALYQMAAAPVAADGSFQLEGVLPERYQLFIDRISEGKTTRIGGANFQVETLPEGFMEEPLDLGEIGVRELPKASVSSKPGNELK